MDHHAPAGAVEGSRPASFYASPTEALAAPAERFAYVSAMHTGTGVDAPDFIAVVDTDPASPTYGTILHETPMTAIGDEFHHFGWNRCSSACHGPDRSHLIVPGFRSSRVYILDVTEDPRRP
jgi:selenium-binding protein 1